MKVYYEIAKSIMKRIQIKSEIKCVPCDSQVQKYTYWPTHIVVLVGDVDSDGS